MRALNKNDVLKELGRAGRSSWVVAAGRVLSVVGVALGEYQNYEADHKNGRSTASALTEATVQTVVDTAIGWGAVEGGAEVGALIGTMIAPGVGTLIGAGVGALIAAAGAYFASEHANNIIDSLWSW